LAQPQCNYVWDNETCPCVSEAFPKCHPKENPKEGWMFIWLGRNYTKNAHYVREKDGRISSICGRYLILGKPELKEEISVTLHCAACDKKLLKEKLKGK